MQEGPGGESLKVLDWTSDGHFLAVVTPRMDRSTLELIPVSDGGPGGPLVLIHSGSFIKGGTTTAGALIYSAARPKDMYDVRQASLAGNRIGDWEKLEFAGGNGYPSDWSPDGNRIVYSISEAEAGRFGDRVHVRDLSTGQDRELYRGAGFVWCIWSKQGPKLFCGERTARTEIFSLSTDSGEIQKFYSFDARNVFPFLVSGDDRALYFLKDQEQAWVRRLDLATRQETAIADPEPGRYLGMPSPDGRWMAQHKAAELQIRPLSGGE
jgi:hypothetical protein